MDANKYKHITSTTFAKVAPYSTRKTQVEMACGYLTARNGGVLPKGNKTWTEDDWIAHAFLESTFDEEKIAREFLKDKFGVFEDG